MKIILLLFLFIILFYYIKTLCKKEAFDEEYNSITKIEGEYEIYSENDKFYPSYKINIKKRDTLKKLLKYGDDFFEKHKINYSIIYGSLLGYTRNKKIIPYDHDVDCIVGIDSINTFIKLGNDKTIKNVIFNDELTEYDIDLKSDKIYLILNKSLLTNNGYGKRYNCPGTNKCSFKGLLGRFILGNIEYDIFPFNTDLSILKKHKFYPEKLSNMSVLTKDHIERNKLDNIDVSVLKNPLRIGLLKLRYGDNFIKPNK